jgi:hypothetical protein
MNIVKLQNDLKDLSDQQLLGTMQTGATPQYLVLAEMQRRKKMRDEASTPNEPQAQGTVADEIMSGIAQLPMQAPQMASGGLVSFAEGGRGKDKDKEEDRDWRYYKPNAGLFGKTDTPLMMLNPQYWSNMLQDMQGVPREEWRGQGAPGVLAYAKGGYLQGEADACWKNPETGEQMCPPSKPKVEYPETGQRKSMAGGGIVALQAGGTPSEARAMLAARGIDTTGMSDEEVMGLAAANTDVPVPNVDVAEPSPMGFAPVSPDMSVAPPPVTKPEPAPKAQSGFMDKLTGGISSLLGMGDAVAAETPPVENPVVPIEVMKDPEQARNWLGENAPAWYDPSKRSDAQVLEDIKSYQPGGAQYERGQADKTNADVAKARGKDSWNIIEPTKEESEARMSTQPRAPAFAGDEATRTFQEESAKAKTQAEREEAARRFTEQQQAEQARRKAEAEKNVTRVPYPGSGGAKPKTEAGTGGAGTGYDQPLPDQPEGLAALISDPTMERYYDLLRQEKGVKDKSNINRYLMEMGLRMAAGKSPDFLTNLAEAGIGTLESAGKLSEEERKREEAISEEISKLLAAREVSLAKAETAQLTQLARANTRLSQISKDLEDLSLTPEKRKELEEERSMLIEYTKGLYPGGGSKYSEAGRAAAAAASFNL